MNISLLNNRPLTFRTAFFSAALITLNSCLPPLISKPPADRPYIIGNSIEVKGGNFTKSEKTDLEQRLYNQLDDSSKVTTNDILFIFHVIKRPPAWDSIYAEKSAAGIRASLFHLGYYHAAASYKADKKGKRVKVNYTVEAGTPTRIDNVSYKMSSPGLQQLVNQSKDQSYLITSQPVTKAAVANEISRLVDSCRNNGYYKITAAEFSVMGDTSIAPLTSVSEDPFEQIRLIAEAQRLRDSPRIDLSVVLNSPSDSSRLDQYRIRKIFVFPDFRRYDRPEDTTLRPTYINGIILFTHNPLFKPEYLNRIISLHPGNLFRQQDYFKTLNNLGRAGVWSSVNVRLVESPDSLGWLDVVIELVPGRKFGFEAALEASYLSTTNATSALAGNLFGLSMNLSLQNRNLGKEAIKMTHTFRGGIELNNNRSGAVARIINSNEISYLNNISIPRLIVPGFSRRFTSGGETFINTNAALTNRVGLFNMQTYLLSMGWSTTVPHFPSWRMLLRPLNAEFNFLFNKTDSFTSILSANPFLKYSYNTAYVTGMSVSLLHTNSSLRHPHSKSRDYSLRFNLEESGLTWGNLPFLKKYLRRFIKMEAEWKYTVSYPKTTLAFRGFAGVGVPLLGSDTNRTLPFFKQFFGGGVNSMRGWPARGIGIGGQTKTPFSSSQTIFNDRTGDLQLEGNIEYRYTIARIIPNTLTLRGALFMDIGNVWNMRNVQPTGTDSAQFKFSNLYRQLGMSAGTGFRIDFNYVVLRLDLGFRFKRPDLYYINDGWKAPSIGFDDFFKKILSRDYRQWRYENFNFSIGISYPF
jgi:hypothetical protein